MQIEYIPLSEIIAWDENPKEHDQELIDQSFEQFGFRVPVIINRNNKTIEAGHGRIEQLIARKKAGVKHPDNIKIDKATQDWMVPCIQFDDDETTQKKFALIDNRTTERGGYNKGKLLTTLEKVKNLSGGLNGTGFMQKDIDALIKTTKPAGKTNIKAITEYNADQVTRLGDFFEIGSHRLICGDSLSDGGLIEKLLKSVSREKVDVVVIDPPYNMGYEGPIRGGFDKTDEGEWDIKDRGFEKVENDDVPDNEAKFAMDIIVKIIKQYCVGAYYIFYYPKKINIVMNAIENAGMAWRNHIIWYKNNFTLSPSDYKSAYESIIYGWVEKHFFTANAFGKNKADKIGEQSESDVINLSKGTRENAMAISGKAFYFKVQGTNRYYKLEQISKPSTFFEIPDEGSAQFNFVDPRGFDIWEIQREKSNKQHQTQKPIELIERTLINSTKPGDITLDFFAGSGTLLKAAERLGRIALLAELVPKNCDNIIEWAKENGLKVIRTRDGNQEEI